MEQLLKLVHEHNLLGMRRGPEPRAAKKYTVSTGCRRVLFPLEVVERLSCSLLSPIWCERWRSTTLQAPAGAEVPLCALGCVCLCEVQWETWCIFRSVSYLLKAVDLQREAALIAE